MAVGEIFLSAFLQVLLDKLASRDFLNFACQEGIDKRLMAWRRILYAIAEVLNDAEEKQLISKEVKLWLDDLKDLAYDVEDVLDKISTEMLRGKLKEQKGTGASKVRSLIPKVKLLKFNMNSEIKEITHRLQEISERKDELSLIYIGIKSTSNAWRRPSSSYVLSGQPVVGRDDDKEKIIELLSRDEPTAVNYDVVAIVGMPGVGKTTLAQLLLNESNGTMEEFNPKVWISVSDDFNLVRVTRAILESVTSQHCRLEEFNNVQESLSKELENKKFIIILDDVWNTCDYDLWRKLQSPFRVGAIGSRILVTTRDAKVARTVGATKVHNLQCLSNDDCWKVFEQHAFDINNGLQPNFGLLRDKIVARCGGLPLAARTLGGLLGCKQDDEWEEILNNKLWSTSNESGILPVLRLSYLYLPSNLKRCFAYCSLLPNNHDFDEKQLILLWMAEGLLQLPEERKEMEDTGGDYFGELLSRSLFQKSSKGNSLYIMHDLVGDLARWAAGEFCFRFEDKGSGRCSSKIRHISYTSGNYDGVKKFETISKVKCDKLEALSELKRLRTFLPLPLSHDPQNYLTSQVTLHLLQDLQYLRVLSLYGYQITELPNTIGMLKYMKYLDLSHTLIVTFPESTSKLYNLQTLILDNCSKLKALPANMRNLTNLRHLSNLNVPSLQGMPPQLSQLTNLQTLPNFVAGKGSDSSVREIGPLSLLRGTLRLSRLENVIDAEDARQTDLISKKGLNALQLEWSDKKENEQAVLDMLKPHGNLKELTVKGYGGLRFSTWIGDPLFSNMVLVRLENCNDCEFLPPLGQLRFLKELYVRGMARVESVGHEFYGNGSLSFPLLETLEFQDMQQWKEWFPCQGGRETGVFRSLKQLSIKRCLKLKGSLPKHLGLLEQLEIDECDKLAVSIANYKQLSTLSVQDCKGCRIRVDLEQLKDITLFVPELRFQADGFMTGLRKVEKLTIGDCDDPEFAWPYLISLRNLRISTNSRLQQLHQLTSLQTLYMYKCQSLFSIPEAILPPSLETISIDTCNSLTCFVRYQMPRGLRSIIIRECQKLTLLLDEEEKELEGPSSSSRCRREEETACLEYLAILDCPSIKSFSFKGQLSLPALKHLEVSNCDQLVSTSDSLLQDNTCLEFIDIYDCVNLKSLPEGLCHLTSLRFFYIRNCGSLVSFPSGGLPTRASNLFYIAIASCSKLQALPYGMNLNSLEKLSIAYCNGLTPILEEGLSSNLTHLTIWQPYSCKPLSQWGLTLNKLTSLKELWLGGVDLDMSSFPPEGQDMLLPKSLIILNISYFPNLRRLSSQGFQFLTSLESLEIRDCPKLEYIPEDLALSLTQLRIYDHCPLLRKRYKPGNARYWATIAHIPYIDIGDLTLQQ